MKKRVIAAAVLLLLLAPTLSFAGSGYEGGFYTNNEDDTFRLTTSGRVQPQLFYEKEKQGPAIFSFAMRRAEVSFNATVHEKGHLGLTLKHSQFSPGGTGTFATVNVTGAYASIDVIPELTITAGMVGLPLSFINEVSSKWLLVTESPIVVSEDDVSFPLTPLRSSFGTPDGLGINLSGGYWKWFYSLSVVGANESNYEINKDSKRMSVGFWTGFNILDPVPGKLTDFDCSDTPKFMVSVGSDYQPKRYQYDPSNPNANPVEIGYIWTSSLGTAVRWAGLSFTAEGFYKRTKINNPGYLAGSGAAWIRPMLTEMGYYAAAGYYIIPKKFEIAAQASQAFRQGPGNDSWELGGGLNYYIFENNMKLQLNYRMYRFFAEDSDPNDPNFGTYTRNNAQHDVVLMLSATF